MLKKIQSRLSYQLLFNIFSVVLLLVLVISAFVAYYMTQVTQKELNERMLADLQLGAREVEVLFDNAATRVRQMGLDESIQRYLREVESRDQITTHPLFERVYASLNAIAQSDKDVYLAWVANEKANFYLDSSMVVPDDTYQVKKRPWYPVAMENQGVAFTDPYVEWITKEIVVSAIEAQRYTGAAGEPEGAKIGEVYGFTVIDFRLYNLPRVLSDIDVGKEGKVFVLDRKGNFLYHENPEKVLNANMRDEFPDLSRWLDKVDASDPVVDAKSHVSKDLRIDGRRYLAFERHIAPMGWSLISLVSYDEMAREQRILMFGVVSATLVMLSMLGFGIHRVIVAKLKPIEALKAYANDIASGHFEASTPYHYTSRSDEMGEMARAFVTISEVFKQKNSLLQEVVSAQYQEIQQQYHYILEKEKIASIGTLVAGIAHEINTPLGVGVTTASYIEQSIHELKSAYETKSLSATKLEQELHALTDASFIMGNNLRRAADLVTQFKAVATNQNISELAPMHLYQELENVIASLKPTYKYRNVEIRNEVDPTIYLTSFAGAFNQIFVNLIVNSMNHGFDEQQSGRILIKAWHDGELVRIVYEDDGKGIDRDVIRRIFEPFFTTRRSGGNSGLGMYITHNLVTQTLSGTLNVESEPGKGVRFTIVVPMHLVIDEPFI